MNNMATKIYELMKTNEGVDIDTIIKDNAIELVNLAMKDINALKNKTDEMKKSLDYVKNRDYNEITINDVPSSEYSKFVTYKHAIDYVKGLNYE